MPTDPKHVQAVFLAAVEKASGDRAAFLNSECGSDTELRRRVDALLQAHDEPGSVLDFSPAQMGPTIDQNPSQRLGTTIGPYKLLQQIGEGGMGVVYMAEQTQPVERRVALKIIKPGMDSRQVVARFEAERQALAMMDHPNIAKVLDAGTTDAGRPYFVMELVKGVPITRYCDEKRLSLRERLELMIPVCHAIQHAHQKGIIHRDIKPTNVLIAQYDDRPVPKVIDFGVAKATARKLTEQTMFTELGQVVGTVEYMSPEQAELNQLDIDTRSDVYSLGVLLYELMTGCTPFDKQKLRVAAFHEMLRIIREEEPPRPSTKLSSTETLPSIATNRSTEPARLAKSIRGEVDWIVMKCLEKDRNRRYETANVLATDLQRYLANEPVLAGPPTRWYRLTKFARRNKGPVLAAAALAAAVALGLVGVTWQWLEAKTQRDVADEQRQRAEDHYEKAFAAVDRMLSRVGDKALAHVPYMDEERRRLLEDAVEFYKGFLSERSSDPSVREEMARAYTKVANLYELLGRNEQAEQAWQRALELQQALVAEFPGEPNYRQQAAISHRAMGLLLTQTDRRPLAEPVYQQAIQIQRALVHDHSERADFQFELVKNYQELAELYRLDGRLNDSLVVLQQGLELVQSLALRSPDNAGYQDALAHCYHTRAIAARDLGQARESLEAFEAARQIWERLARDNPESTQYANFLAGAYVNLGPAFRALERTQDAAEAYEAALKILKRLAEEHPHVPDYQVRLAKVHNNLGFFYDRLGQAAPCERHYQEALALHGDLARRFPKRVEYALNVASSSANWANYLRDHGKAAQSMPLFDEAIRAITAVAEHVPADLLARRTLHIAHFGRALAHLKLNRPEDARHDWERVVELSEGQTEDNNRIYRPRALAYVGKHSESIREVEAMVAAGEKRAWALEECARACVLSSTAVGDDTGLSANEQSELKEGYAALAVELLARAGTSGNYQAVGKVEGLKKNSLFEPLRARLDYQNLINELERKSVPP